RLVGLAVAIAIPLFLRDVTAGELDPGVDLSVVVAVRLFVDRVALVVVHADDVLDAVEVGVDLTAEEDATSIVALPHDAEDPAHVRERRSGAIRLDDLAIRASLVVAARLVV